MYAGEGERRGQSAFFVLLFHACLFLFLFPKDPTAPTWHCDPPLPAFGPRVRRFLLACLRIACLARLFGLMCVSACKMRGVPAGGRIRGRVKVSELKRASPKGSCSADGYKTGSLEVLHRVHGRPSGLWPQKKEFLRDAHNSCRFPSPCRLHPLLPLTWQSLPHTRTATPTSLKTSFTAGGLNTA